jgi:ABC-type sugar transport system ATPase subunit
LPPDAPLLRLRVSAVDYLGSITELHGTVPGAFDGSPWLARLAGRHRATTGEEVTLTWNPSHAHLFNPESGARLSIATHAARPSHRHEH